MAIDRTFDELLTEKLHPELLRNEIIDRAAILQKIDMDNTWKGGNYGYAFQEASAGSVQFDGFVAEEDVAEGEYARGNLTEVKSLTGTLKFKHRDLIEHDTQKVTEASFLKILPKAIDDFAMTFKNVIAQNILNGKVLAKGVANGTALGVLAVNRIERFKVGMKVEVEDADSALASYYVTKVNKENLLAPFIVLSATRGGAAADLSALTTASTGIKIYHPGQKLKGFHSLKEILDPTTTSLFGLSKADYSYLQTPAFNGSSITSSNILDKIFDYVTELRIAAGSEASEVWVSGRQFGAVLKQLEGEKKAFAIIPGSRVISKYGWQEVKVGSITGDLVTIVSMIEMDDDCMMVVNPKDFKFATNGFIREVKTPEGHRYTHVRTTSGHYYLMDWEIFGEICCIAPCKQAFVHSIPAL